MSTSNSHRSGAWRMGISLMLLASALCVNIVATVHGFQAHGLRPNAAGYWAVSLIANALVLAVIYLPLRRDAAPSGIRRRDRIVLLTVSGGCTIINAFALASSIWGWRNSVWGILLTACSGLVTWVLTAPLWSRRS